MSSVDLNPPAGERPGPGGRSSLCEFCGCRLSAAGEVLERSARAKQILEANDELARLARELDTAQRAVTDLTAQVAAMRAAVPPEPSITTPSKKSMFAKE